MGAIIARGKIRIPCYLAQLALHLPLDPYLHPGPFRQFAA
jgi:hypothetical protein